MTTTAASREEWTRGESSCDLVLLLITDYGSLTYWNKGGTLFQSYSKFSLYSA
jgi:hypothetical protein